MQNGDSREYHVRTMMKLKEMNSWIDINSEWTKQTEVRLRLPE